MASDQHRGRARERRDRLFLDGKKSTDTLIYDGLGNMAVQAMRDPRALFAPEHALLWGTCTPEEIADAYRGYYAYFGTYEIDSGKCSIIHHVEGSLWPNEVGITYTRLVSLADDLLTLESQPVDFKGEICESAPKWDPWA